MAVPKSKVSRTRRDKRRGSNWKLTAPALVKCPQCGGDLIERHSKTGRLFYGCSNYPTCRFVSWDKPTDEKCPQCGSMMLEHRERSGKTVLHCSNEKCPNASLKKK